MTHAVPATILAQLGGNRFTMMTGAKNFTGSTDALSFVLPARFAKHGIRYVRIVLEASDLYRVAFLNSKAVEVAGCCGIYADQLRNIFTKHTGLDTAL
jgi:hypothetical protein